MKFVSKIVQKLSLLNAPETTVLSFIIVSILGGTLLWCTEHNRVVQAKVPVLQATVLYANPPIHPTINLTSQTENHVYTANIEYRGEKFIDTFFTAVSALCVTGLTSTDFSKFTLPGQIVTLILIQMGGLGIIVFTSIFAYLIARGISEKEIFKRLISGVLDTERPVVERMLKHIIKYTFIIETIGTLVMGIYFQFFTDTKAIHHINPWWWSLFHSVSAFNNAGFSLTKYSLTDFPTDPIINLTIAFLVILGGLGYPVLIATRSGLRKKILGKDDAKQRKLNEDVKDVVASPVQTRIAIVGTIMLLTLGTIIPLVLEWSSDALAGFSPAQKLTVAFFHSTSTRSGGFSTINIGTSHAATLVFYMLLMYIGANPAGTAGGIKIPTVAVLYGYIKDWFKKPGEPVFLLGRKVSKFAVSHAVRLFSFSIIFIITIIFLICIAETKYLVVPDANFNFIKIIFETISAFGTVGLSMGFTNGFTSFSTILTGFSKFLLTIAMLFGRVGPLTILSAMPWKRKFFHHPLSSDYDGVEKIQIG